MKKNFKNNITRRKLMKGVAAAGTRRGAKLARGQPSSQACWQSAHRAQRSGDQPVGGCCLLYTSPSPRD